MNPYVSFQDVLTQLRTYIQNGQQGQAKEFVSALDRFKIELNTIPTYYIFSFVKQQYTNLHTLYNATKDSGNKALKQLSTDIFQKYLLSSDFSVQPITQIFKEFVRGITFFVDNEHYSNSEPIYHRSASCGSFFDITSLHYNSQVHGIVERIEKCLIERLIFDAIFKQLTLYFPKIGTDEPSQDVKHTKMLFDMLTRYRMCPGKDSIDVYVDVDVDENNIPYRVTITKRLSNVDIEEEIYVKTYVLAKNGNKLYNNKVSCFMRKNKVEYFQKTQSFEKEQAWNQVDSFSNGQYTIQRSLSFGGGRRKHSKATWSRTTRKVKVTQGRGKDAKTVEKTVYKNSKTGELRVRKMVTRKGERKVTYVKF